MNRYRSQIREIISHNTVAAGGTQQGAGRTVNQLAPLPSFALPALVASADDPTQRRFLEFFAVTIRNPHTRRAYARAAGEFLAWCDARRVTSIADVQHYRRAGADVVLVGEALVTHGDPVATVREFQAVR